MHQARILAAWQVSTVYAVAIGTPSWGEIGPLTIGLSLFAAATSGAQSAPDAMGVCKRYRQGCF